MINGAAKNIYKNFHKYLPSDINIVVSSHTKIFHSISYIKTKFPHVQMQFRKTPNSIQALDQSVPGRARHNQSYTGQNPFSRSFRSPFKYYILNYVRKAKPYNIKPFGPNKAMAGSYPKLRTSYCAWAVHLCVHYFCSLYLRFIYFLSNLSIYLFGVCLSDVYPFLCGKKADGKIKQWPV